MKSQSVTTNLSQKTIQLTFKTKLMKTSDKLLLFLLFVFLVATLANNLVLKFEYEKVKISSHESAERN